MEQSALEDENQIDYAVMWNTISKCGIIYEDPLE
jgi:hypothetical protein